MRLLEPIGDPFVFEFFNGFSAGIRVDRRGGQSIDRVRVCLLDFFVAAQFKLEGAPGLVSHEDWIRGDHPDLLLDFLNGFTSLGARLRRGCLLLLNGRGIWVLVGCTLVDEMDLEFDARAFLPDFVCNLVLVGLLILLWLGLDSFRVRLLGLGVVGSDGLLLLSLGYSQDGLIRLMKRLIANELAL